MTATTAPYRVQLHRTKGYRMPAHTRSVNRSSRYGNAHRIGTMARLVLPGGELRPDTVLLTRKQAVASHRNELLADPKTARAAREDLRGWNLACSCALDQMCHADTLLLIANCTDEEFEQLLNPIASPF